LVSQVSKIPSSVTSLTYPSVTSIPKTLLSLVLAYKSAIIASGLCPAFSAIILGIISKAWPNLSMAYWSRPG
jgi:hypothetical protein